MAPALGINLQVADSAEVLHDLPVWLALDAWVALVTMVISRKAFEALRARGWDEARARYVGRKAIHILGGGAAAAVVLAYFREPLLPLLSSLAIAGYVYARHGSKPMYWFQDPSNKYDVTFPLTWGAVLFAGWVLTGSFAVGAAPALYMALGDGVTGLVRAVRRGRREKSWDGTAAMLAVSLAIGAGLGVAGLASAVAASLVERWGAVDDNVTVPLASFAVLAASLALAPWTLRPLA